MKLSFTMSLLHLIDQKLNVFSVTAAQAVVAAGIQKIFYRFILTYSFLYFSGHVIVSIVTSQSPCMAHSV